jgi:predicted nucleic acid-binding protein
MSSSGNGPSDRLEIGSGLNVAFVDASALVALADWDDISHGAAVAAYDDLVANGFALFTTNLAFIQAHCLLTAVLGPDVALMWLERCRIPIYPISAEDLATARSNVASSGATDESAMTTAVHLAVLDRLGVSDVFAVERDFLAALG